MCVSDVSHIYHLMVEYHSFIRTPPLLYFRNFLFLSLFSLQSAITSFADEGLTFASESFAKSVSLSFSFCSIFFFCIDRFSWCSCSCTLVFRFSHTAYCKLCKKLETLKRVNEKQEKKRMLDNTNVAHGAKIELVVLSFLSFFLSCAFCFDFIWFVISLTTNYLYRMYNAAWIVLPLKEIDFIYKNIYQSIWTSRKKSNRKNSVTNLDISWPHAFCIQFGLLLLGFFFRFLLSNMHTHSGVWMTGSTYHMYYNGGYSCHTMRTEFTVCNKLIRFVSRLTAIPHSFSFLSVHAIFFEQFWGLLCMKERSKEREWEPKKQKRQT